MEIDAQRKTAAILQILSDAGKPLGSLRIARELKAHGFDLGPRMVRYYLDQMDAATLTRNLGRRGRELTDRGRRELESAVAVDRVGFVSARVDELAYSLTFDLDRQQGSVILNLSLLRATQYRRARRIVERILSARLGMGSQVIALEPGEAIGGVTVPAGHVGIGTVCSVTMNGILYSSGIPILSRFGGLLEVQRGEPTRFTQIIHYDGTTIDPIEIFIKGGMTRVNEAERTGNGTIGASFREVPAAALDQIVRLAERLDGVGLGGVLLIGTPGQPVLDVPVTHGRVGVVVAAGLNPMAAVEEAGITTENRAMSLLCEFERLSGLR